MTVVRTARKQGKALLDFTARSIRAHLDGMTAPRLMSSQSHSAIGTSTPGLNGYRCEARQLSMP